MVQTQSGVIRLQNFMLVVDAVGNNAASFCKQERTLFLVYVQQGLERLTAIINCVKVQGRDNNFSWTHLKKGI